MSDFRIETDSMGEVNVPKDALYRAQTQRAVNNFPISFNPLPVEFIRAIVMVKAAASQANSKLENISKDCGIAISEACQKLLDDEKLMSHFPVDIFQTGSGTSSNMNANEVISTLASALGQSAVHPNDHVNCSQSSNDVIPTSIHVSTVLGLKEQLLPALEYSINAINHKADSIDHICKTGRTHLMDAMPIRMSQSLRCWTAQLQQHVDTLQHHSQVLSQLPIGGTAVGTGVNADPAFSQLVCDALSHTCDMPFTPLENKFVAISSQDATVACSGALKAVAVTVMKIANDLRWMNSGPLSGISEIALPELQPGSSIMPGKVNPVIPESAAMVAAQVMGNDTTVTIAGQSGNFELNVMLPVIAQNVISSIVLLSNTLHTLTDKAIVGFEVKEDNITQALYRNPILVTALNPIIGYEKAAEIAKTAYKQNRSVIDVSEEMTNLSNDELMKLLDPIKLTGK